MIIFDGFIDSYYSYDFMRPKNNERLYTTQAVRHNEPSINLAYLGAKYSDSKFRGRLAFQGGNSVVANTLYEPNPDLGVIQEAYLGIRVSENAWIDAGVYLGHIGMESWISKNNFTYTRSLLLDYVPYYSTGLRYVNDISSDTHFEFHLMEGWQNISETNSSKSFGFQFKKIINEFTLSYNNYFGDERVIPGQENRFRTYHNFIVEMTISDRFKWQGSLDFGTQAQQKNSGVDAWQASAISFQYKLSPKSYLAWRAENYLDSHQSNVQTGTKNGFQVLGSSVNYDYHFDNNTLWRTEFKTLQSKDKIYFKSKSSVNEDHALITNLSLAF
jgi:Putative beta-barrel porin-2, OmpL-like. bbp2